MSDSGLRNRHAMTLACCTWTLAIVGGTAHAQNASDAARLEALKQKYASITASINPPPPSIPVGAETLTVPAQDWQVWVAFHENLKFQNQRTPDKLRAVFEKHGVGKASLDAVMNAGIHYASDLAAIDESARAEILAKYGYKGAHAAAAARINADRGRAGTPEAPSKPLLLDLKPGQSLDEELKRDGTTARYFAQRRAALNQHRAALRQALGPTAAKNLEDWVDMEVAPNVREVVQAARVSGSATGTPTVTGNSATPGAR